VTVYVCVRESARSASVCVSFVLTPFFPEIMCVLNDVRTKPVKVTETFSFFFLSIFEVTNESIEMRHEEKKRGQNENTFISHKHDIKMQGAPTDSR